MLPTHRLIDIANSLSDLISERPNHDRLDHELTAPVLRELFVTRLQRQDANEAECRVSALWNHAVEKRDAEEIAFASASILECVFSPRAAVDSRALPSRLLHKIAAAELKGLPALYVDAFLAEMRSLHLISFCPELAQSVVELQAKLAKQSTTLASKMRAAAMIEDWSLLLLCGSPAESVIQTIKAIGTQLQLNRATIPILCAHIGPLARRGHYGPAVAVAILESLNRWADQLDEHRSAFTNQCRQAAKLTIPDLAVYKEELYARELGRLLSKVADDLPTRGAPLPDAVFYETIFNELAPLFVEHVIAQWVDEPNVVASIFRLLCRMRSLRLDARKIIERWMSRPNLPSNVQLAILEFAQSFLSGLSRSAALQHLPTMMPLDTAEQQRELTNNLRFALEADPQIRDLLVQIAFDTERPDEVRRHSLTIVLRCAPPADELLVISHRAAQGDCVMVEALLDYVIHEGASNAFDQLEIIYNRYSQFDEPLRRKYLAALVAAGHEDTPRLLQNQIDHGETSAEQVLAEMGADGLLRQLRHFRSLRQESVNLAHLQEKCRNAVIEKTSEHLDAVKESFGAESYFVEARGRTEVGTLLTVEFFGEQASLKATTLIHVKRIQELTGLLPNLGNTVVALLESGKRLEEQVRDLSRQMEEMEQRKRNAEITIAANRQKRQQLETEQDRILTESPQIRKQAEEQKTVLDKAENELEQITERLDRGKADCEDAIVEYKRQFELCRSAGAELARIRRNIGSGTTDFTLVEAAEDQVQRAESALLAARSAGDSAARALNQVNQAQSDIEEKYHTARDRYQQLSARRETLETRLDQIPVQIAQLDKHSEYLQRDLEQINQQLVTTSHQKRDSEDALNIQNRTRVKTEEQICEVKHCIEMEQAQIKRMREELETTIDQHRKILKEAESDADSALNQAKRHHEAAVAAQARSDAADQQAEGYHEDALKLRQQIHGRRAAVFASQQVSAEELARSCLARKEEFLRRTYEKQQHQRAVLVNDVLLLVLRAACGFSPETQRIHRWLNYERE